MSTVQLLKPILEGGIRSTHFFNGRVLSGEDMNVEKEARREADRLLGRAIGDGVAYGLEVSKAIGPATSPVLTIESGLAINRKGQALRLPVRVDLSLLRGAEAAMAGTSGFADCQPTQSSVYVANPGIYLLTINPGEGSEGRAPVSGIQNVAAACNTRYLIEGVQFRLIQLKLTSSELGDANRLRNIVAYKCFGVDELKSVIANPFGPVKSSYGLLDALRPNPLTDCDVPLAVLHWTATQGIRFVDMWSVRRRLTQATSTLDWSLFGAERRAREGESMFFQFQRQIEQMRIDLSQTAVLQTVAESHFRYLPPLGILRLGGVAGTKGFDYQNFFRNQPSRGPAFIEGAKLEAAVRESFAFAPIELSKRELIWLYLVRENSQAIDSGIPNPPQPFLVFAAGETPYQSDPRFDLSRWNYSNYSVTHA